MDLANKYYFYKFGIYEVSDINNQKAYAKYGFDSVPLFVIETDDRREIKFVGADERRLKCEVEQMTTKECPTYYNQCVN